VRLLRNDLPARNWLSVQLDGAGLGVGARVAVKADGLPAQWRRIHTDSSYLSSSDPRAHFGLASAARVESITVHWPDGSETRRDANTKLNSLVRISKDSPK